MTGLRNGIPGQWLFEGQIFSVEKTDTLSALGGVLVGRDKESEWEASKSRTGELQFVVIRRNSLQICLCDCVQQLPSIMNAMTMLSP